MISLNSVPLWDGRTKKMDDFKKQPWAEICWYFTETREQYRLSGKISVIDANAEDKAQRVIVGPLKCMAAICNQIAVSKDLWYSAFIRLIARLLDPKAWKGDLTHVI